MLMLHFNKNLKVNRQDYQNENKYNELLNKFNELGYEIKNSLNKKYILIKNMTKKYL